MSLLNKVLSFLIILSSVIASLLLYGLVFNEPEAIQWRAISVAVVVVLGIVRIGYLKGASAVFWFKSGFKNKLVLVWPLVLIGSVIVGSVFLGNIFANNVINKKVFGHKDAIFAKVTMEKPSYGHPGKLRLPFNIKDVREHGLWNQHNIGLHGFLSYYGGVLLLMFMGFYLYVHAQESCREVRIEDKVLFEVFLASVMSVPFFLFCMDFVDTGMRTWVQSRFLEIPVYVIVFIVLYFLYRFSSKWMQATVAVILLVYTITPWVANKRLEQIKSNHYLFEKLQEKASK